MKLARQTERRESESTLSLINIVFLMLIFFLVAGTLATPIDKSLEPAATSAMPFAASDPSTIGVRADETLVWKGQDITLEDLTLGLTEEKLTSVKIIPDRTLAAEKLVSLLTRLKEGGVKSIKVVTVRQGGGS